MTIALLEGRARGAGGEFLYACDMRFASLERAVIGQPEVGTGVFPGAGAVQQIVRLAGRGQAMQVILGGEDVDAREAERIGLVNRALPDDELIAYVKALAERIGSFPEAAVRLAKRRINAAALPAKEDVQVDGVLPDPRPRRLEHVARGGAHGARTAAALPHGTRVRRRAGRALIAMSD
ncbi:enoyl-CoA hydratase/isomerase family protein [Micromonospora sp. IBHARD004]|uniref:enoyl-CoA hydratase/isomerase family protein n=1 Tax=Micromonospora sp. IBHARD004 TaxID=3457764 RepID=UPI00405865BF